MRQRRAGRSRFRCVALRSNGATGTDLDMIVAIRSALICESATQDAEGRVNYIGVLADRLAAYSRPGIIECCLTLVLDLDKRATEGFIRIRSEGFTPADAPISVPAGWSGMSTAVPMLVPVVAPGFLRVEVHDEARRLKPFKLMWSLEFSKDAQELDPAAAADFIKTGEQVGEIAALSLRRSKGTKPN